MIGPLFAVTSLQSMLLAVHAPASLIAAAALLAGFAFSYGTVIWLWIGAAWIIVATALVLGVREVRDFRVGRTAEAVPATQA